MKHMNEKENMGIKEKAANWVAEWLETKASKSSKYCTYLPLYEPETPKIIIASETKEE